MAMALAHVSEVPRPPSERSEVAIPPALDALILQCLAKDPAGRPASALELASRLAAPVPADAWTDDHAHQWWQLHWEPPVSTPRQEVAEEDAGRRCWPRFERDASVSR